ncbi:TadE/TadG family type IV pilus assembly protein [Agrococcus jejuensis]|uniref:TadE-like protein n=1 Tax=Agrococcus jejuensis TaxID=399736 RepID=A0A1G8E9J8_9MICO|nr:TadE family protein [Agrococcus jejuensis]SDH66517.1 TadE-like protein [Agrococcus jejuensis]
MRALRTRALREARDRGAVAVEFAIVLPVLVALTLGILAFGYALHIQSVLDASAREAVRIAAISTLPDRAAAAREAAIATATPSVTLQPSNIAISPITCLIGDRVTVTITVDHQLLGGLGAIELTGRGTMRCGG